MTVHTASGITESVSTGYREEFSMSEVVIDRALVARLAGLDSTTTIRDESGRVLGFFVPAAEAAALWPGTDECPYTHEELDRFRNEKGGRRLSEIWKSLGQQ
jgi:hypothetical protein